MVGHGRAVGSKEAVARGYDRVGGRYGELALKADFDERARYVDALIDGLPSGARLLDLGCGAGVPTTRRLAEHFEGDRRRYITAASGAGTVQRSGGDIPVGGYVIA